MKRLKRVLFVLGILYAIAVLVSSCLTSRFSDEDMRRYFADSRYPAHSQHYMALGRTLHYVQTGDSLRPPLLFVHGSPGSWDNFKAFLKDSVLLNGYKLMSLDRPGFGRSAQDGAETHLRQQAAALLPILKQQRQPVILVGHSYGGPVIVQAAISYPQYVKGLVIVAGSVAPHLEPSNWYRYPLRYTPLRWAIPAFLRSSNDELLPLEKELRKMESQWHKVRCPVVVQGGKDVLVAPENAQFVENKLPHVRVTTIWKENMNHFVPWSDPDLILKGIEALNKKQ